MLSKRLQILLSKNIFLNEISLLLHSAPLFKSLPETGNYCLECQLNNAPGLLSCFTTSVVAQLLSHSVMSDSFETPWTAACQASLSITNFWSLLKLMSSELVMPSNHLILCHLLLCHPLLLLPSISPSIRVISNESVLRIRWPKYWSFSISLSNEYSGLISFRVSDPYLTVHDSPLLSGQSVCSMALEGLTSALSQASLHCPCSPSMFLLLRAFLQTASSTWEEPLLFPFRLILRFSA